MVLELDVGPVADEELDEFSGVLVAGDEGCEVEGGFSELGFYAVDDGGVRGVEYVFDLVEGTGWWAEYLFLMAVMNWVNNWSGLPWTLIGG